MSATVVEPMRAKPECSTALWAAVVAARRYLEAAQRSVADRISVGGRPDRDLLDGNQHAAHGLAWVATYVTALDQVAAWFEALTASGEASETEQLLVQLLFAEYLCHLVGGLPMNQSETIRPVDFALDAFVEQHVAGDPAVRAVIAAGRSAALKSRLADLLRAGEGVASVERTALGDELDMIRAEFRKFSDAKILPDAHGWHLRDELIPAAIIDQMSELGVFGLTIPPEFGGAGLGKTAMCVVTEELSRAYIGCGSLGTRSEIAAELILAGGTAEQKGLWLPGIARGSILPTAVFTEPNAGSDLASLRTRAVRDGDEYVVTGGKTWITHAARADMMTLLVRTDPGSADHRGLSILLAKKPRGTDANPFPAAGMAGGEIAVLGYRGMKEYELAFDGFRVPAANLLGDVEGQGFRQLMATFESARVQTAARAVGVAQCAMELGLRYAVERRQFEQQIFQFPRVANKLVLMAAEIMAARQLTYFAAKQKDSGQRCDLEAGMAKLLAARVAWAAADSAVQIHGGNGFALEYSISRVLCDARILNIFEGAAEIQAKVIAQRLLI